MIMLFLISQNIPQAILIEEHCQFLAQLGQAEMSFSEQKLSKSMLGVYIFDFFRTTAYLVTKLTTNVPLGILKKN